MKRINDGHPLREFLASMPNDRRERYARECGTTVNYLRKYLSKRTKLDVSLVAKLVAHSQGRVTFDALREDVDWDQVRKNIPARKRRADRSTSRAEV